MPQELRFDNRVVVVTGAGHGLGRAHALAFAGRGGRVVVNDLGGDPHGGGASASPADEVVAEIQAAGGEAVASYDSVTDGEKIIQCALDHFGRVDVVVNNAGILRDKSFAKMTEEDWDLVYQVHVKGAFKVTHAAWPHLREQEYGRVIFTASAAGIYGNFGQANYSMAKLGLHGLSQTLAIEGQSRNIRVNTIAPIAGSRLTATVMPQEMVDALRPEYVTPLVLYLCHEDCEEGGRLFEVGAGWIGCLRWQRTRGQGFPLGPRYTPEAVSTHWESIVDFNNVTYPTDTTSAMEPIMNNLKGKQQTGQGNELIDVDQALGYEFPSAEVSYDERDVSLYALGIGAASDPTDPKELAFVYERHSQGFKVLPSFGVIPPMKLVFSGQIGQAPGLHYGFDRVLHGEQFLELSGPLPGRTTLTVHSRIRDIYDKGKNAVIVTESTGIDAAGRKRLVSRSTTVVLGAGGWGGERGPTSSDAVPERPPDAVVEERVPRNQALLYRLSGDWNPLHADPAMAATFGFERPILHGLCTFGYATRHVLRELCDNEPGRFRSIQVRFRDSVYPGETLVTEMWRDGDQRVIFQCRVKERDVTVVSNAAVELYEEVPKLEEVATPAQVSPGAQGGEPAAAAGPTSGDVFRRIEGYVAEHPDLVGQVGACFQFKLQEPDSVWVLDLKEGQGSVYEGTREDADCTLHLTDGNFMALVDGSKNAQKMFFTGELQVSGNMMLAQKLTFLSEIPR